MNKTKSQRDTSPKRKLPENYKVKAYYSKPKPANKNVSAGDLVSGVLSAVRDLRTNLTVEIQDKVDGTRSYKVELPLEGGTVPSDAWVNCLEEVSKKEASETVAHVSQLAQLAGEKQKALKQIEAEAELKRKQIELQYRLDQLTAAGKHESVLGWFSQNRETVMALRDSMQLSGPEELVNSESDEDDAEEEDESFVVPDDASLSEYESDEVPEVAIRQTKRKRSPVKERFSNEKNDDDMGEEIEVNDYAGQHIDEQMEGDFMHLFAAKTSELQGNGATLLKLWRQHAFFRTAFEKYLKSCWSCGQEAPGETFTAGRLETMISNLANDQLQVPRLEPMHRPSRGTCAGCRNCRSLRYHLYDAWMPNMMLGCDCANKISEVLKFVRLMGQAITKLRATPAEANTLAWEYWPHFRQCFLDIERMRV